MQLWTTFCPSKITWELTKIASKGGNATSDWLKHQKIIATSVSTLKAHGISGIRLVIFPTEITQNGKEINWQPIETMLTLCAKEKLLVDLCIGPFQYPYYPGIYLPKLLQKEVSNHLYLDDNVVLAEYGMAFLQKQLERYDQDVRVNGFHFANEWPDRQGISGRERQKVSISKAFMIKAADLIKKQTTKPIALNTNIDASDKKKLHDTFFEVLSLLGNQGRLGFDIYPSQETWRKAPMQKLARMRESYARSFAWSCDRFAPCQMYFAEVEAQPWGDGRSWYQIIHTERNPEQQILKYTPHSLQQVFTNHIAQTKTAVVSLWGADFWLSTDGMGIFWPLEQVSLLKNTIARLEK